MTHLVRLELTCTRMPILGALGLALTLFVLQSMVPAIFSELQSTVIVALQSAKAILSTASLIAGAAGPLPR
jgi:hypothetical protein